MRSFLVSCALCAIVAATLAGQTPKYGVTVTAEKNVDFAKFRVYSWTPGQPSASKVIDEQIVAAVDAELKKLGMTKAASGPGDVLVTYYSLTRSDVNLKGKPDAQGARPVYTVGTLTVALLEPRSMRQLLRLRADKPIDTGPEALKQAIDEVAAELFAQYPTRSKK